MSRLRGMPTGRLLTLTGALLFGVFFVVAFVFRRTGVSQETLSIVAGVMAYGFIAFAAAIAWRAWRRRPGPAERAVSRYLSTHPAVVAWLGTPLTLEMPAVPDPDGRPGQANLTVAVAGPLGDASADIVLARLNREWEVLHAVLVLDGERVPLTPLKR